MDKGHGSNTSHLRTNISELRVSLGLVRHGRYFYTAMHLYIYFVDFSFEGTSSISRRCQTVCTVLFSQ